MPWLQGLPSPHRLPSSPAGTAPPLRRGISRSAQSRASGLPRGWVSGKGGVGSGVPACRASSPSPAGAGAGPGAVESPDSRKEDDPVLRGRMERKEAWVPPKPTLGEQLADVIFVFGALLDRPFGSGQSIAAAGFVVVARVRAEIGAALKGVTSGGAEGKGDAGVGGASLAGGPLPSGEDAGDSPLGGMVVAAGSLSAASPAEEQRQVQICFEVLRVMQLLVVDLELVRAAVKEETLLARLEAAKQKCKTALALAKRL